MRLLTMTLLALALLACSPPPDPSPTSPPPMSERQKATFRAMQQFAYNDTLTYQLKRAVYLYYNQCSRVRNLKDDVIDAYEQAMQAMAGLISPSTYEARAVQSDEDIAAVRAVLEVAQDAVYMLEDRCLP